MTTCSRADAGAWFNYPFLTSKERDDETKLDYFLARYYSSTQGRFTSPDEFTGGPDELYNFAEDASDNPTFYAEVDNPQSLNKYQYTYNNPINMTDDDGHCPPCVLAAIAEVGGTALDVVVTIKTVRDPNASRTEKVVTTLGTVGGLLVPGVGGTGTLAKGIFRHVAKRGAKQALATVEAGADVSTGISKGVTGTKAENLRNADAKGIPRDQLGPSGKPKIITKELPTKKRAEDYQQARSKGPLVRDVNPAKGNTHYHTTRKDGSRRTGKQNIHIEPRSKKGRLPD